MTQNLSRRERRAVYGRRSVSRRWHRRPCRADRHDGVSGSLSIRRSFTHTLWKRHNCDAQIPETCDELDTAAGTQQRCRAGEFGRHSL